MPNVNRCLIKDKRSWHQLNRQIYGINWPQVKANTRSTKLIQATCNYISKKMTIFPLCKYNRSIGCRALILCYILILLLSLFGGRSSSKLVPDIDQPLWWARERHLQITKCCAVQLERYCKIHSDVELQSRITISSSHSTPSTARTTSYIQNIKMNPQT